MNSQTAPIADSREQEDIVLFGVPDRRALALAAGEVVVVGLAATLALVWIFRVDDPVALAASGLAILAVAVLAAGLRAEIAVMPRLIARRTWWECAFGRDGEMLLFYPGDSIEKMPDGKWRLDGIPVALPVGRGDASHLAAAMGRAGLAVDDQRSEWRREHRVRRAIHDYLVPPAVLAWAVVLAGMAQAGDLHLAVDAVWLLGAWVLAALWLAVRPPRTKHGAAVSHLPRHAVRPERLAA